MEIKFKNRPTVQPRFAPQDSYLTFIRSLLPFRMARKPRLRWYHIILYGHSGHPVFIDFDAFLLYQTGLTLNPSDSIYSTTFMLKTGERYGTEKQFYNDND